MFVWKRGRGWPIKNVSARWDSRFCIQNVWPFGKINQCLKENKCFHTYVLASRWQQGIWGSKKNIANDLWCLPSCVLINLASYLKHFLFIDWLANSNQSKEWNGDKKLIHFNLVFFRQTARAILFLDLAWATVWPDG